MSRTRPDGLLLSWELLFLGGHRFDLALPFFINWLDSPHPAADTPGTCLLKAFEVTVPDTDRYRSFCQRINLAVDVSDGPVGFRATIQAAAAEVELL